jgi:hypothetical protein
VGFAEVHRLVGVVAGNQLADQMLALAAGAPSDQF